MKSIQSLLVWSATGKRSKLSFLSFLSKHYIERKRGSLRSSFTFVSRQSIYLYQTSEFVQRNNFPHLPGLCIIIRGSNILFKGYESEFEGQVRYAVNIRKISYRNRKCSSLGDHFLISCMWLVVFST